MTAVDGAFNEKIEEVEATVDTSDLAPGRHILFVRSQDASGNWGVFSAVFLTVIDPASVPILQGTVHDSVTGAPLAATVTAGLFVTTTTPADGFYSMRVLSGTYDITADAPGHVPVTVVGLPIHDYQTITQDFDLAPLYLVFGDDVELGNPGWTAEGGWVITAEDAHSPAHSWTDSPGGSYGKNWNYALTSPAFDLSGCDDVTLEFWHTYELETSYDYGYLEYSVNGGATWNQIRRYTGATSGWIGAKQTVPALDGQADARLRFRIKTDGAGVDRDGWHVDDINLFGSGAACLPSTPPVAAFTSSSPVALGQPVVFFNHTTGQEPLDFLWNFGDGAGTSTERDPVYTYASEGTFVVTLTATNTLATDVATGTVEVLACRPVTAVELSLATPDPIYPGDTVSFQVDLAPIDLTLPYTYALLLDGLPVLDGTGDANPLLFTQVLSTTGAHTVQVLVANCGLGPGEALTATVQVLVRQPDVHYVYLPIINEGRVQ